MVLSVGAGGCPDSTPALICDCSGLRAGADPAQDVNLKVVAPEVQGIVWAMSGIPKGLPFMWGTHQNHTGREGYICTHVQSPVFVQPSHRALSFTIAHGDGIPLNHSMHVSPLFSFHL